jgi:general secretion pathway protein A
LQRFDRPALLDVVADGATHRVVLTGLAGATAELQLGDSRERVPLAELSAAWSGDFVLLWRPPELDTRSLSVGMRGTTVKALRERLQQWAGRPVGTGNDLFDADLERQVREFQLRQGLTVDGIAGLQTQVALDAALKVPGTPLLTTSTGS